MDDLGSEIMGADHFRNLGQAWQLDRDIELGEVHVAQVTGQASADARLTRHNTGRKSRHLDPLRVFRVIYNLASFIAGSTDRDHPFLARSLWRPGALPNWLFVRHISPPRAARA